MSSLCQFGSLWMGMFNLLTKNKLNESFNPPHHLSFFFPLILYLLQFPSYYYNSSSQEKLGSLNTFVFFIIFYHVLEFFSIEQTNKNSLLFVFQQTEISQFSRILRYSAEESQISFFLVFLVVFAIQ